MRLDGGENSAVLKWSERKSTRQNPRATQRSGSLAANDNADTFSIATVTSSRAGGQTEGSVFGIHPSRGEHDGTARGGAMPRVFNRRQRQPVSAVETSEMCKVQAVFPPAVCWSGDVADSRRSHPTVATAAPAVQPSGGMDVPRMHCRRAGRCLGARCCHRSP